MKIIGVPQAWQGTFIKARNTVHLSSSLCICCMPYAENTDILAVLYVPETD